MSKKKRKQDLFNKFSTQLHLLKEQGLINVELKYDKTYICPLCLDQFSESDLNVSLVSNFLTEEDAPPASMGGSRIALTCKKCNSDCGHKIDYQLNELIQHEENSSFIRGSVQRGTIDFNGNPIDVELTSVGDGTLQAVHNEKRVNPVIFKSFLKKVKKDIVFAFKPKKNRLDAKKVVFAFYKTNYIITFSKFGYIFLLDSAYDRLRRQILNPEEDILLFNLAIHNAHLRDHIGTHYINDEGIKAIFNIFNLKTSLTTKPYGAFLPVPNLTIENFIDNMEERIINNHAVFNKSEYDEDADLFTDLDEIIRIKSWLES